MPPSSALLVYQPPARRLLLWVSTTPATPVDELIGRHDDSASRQKYRGASLTPAGATRRRGRRWPVSTRQRRAPGGQGVAGSDPVSPTTDVLVRGGVVPRGGTAAVVSVAAAVATRLQQRHPWRAASRRSAASRACAGATWLDLSAVIALRQEQLTEKCIYRPAGFDDHAVSSEGQQAVRRTCSTAWRPPWSGRWP